MHKETSTTHISTITCAEAILGSRPVSRGSRILGSRWTTSVVMGTGGVTSSGSFFTVFIYNQRKSKLLFENRKKRSFKIFLLLKNYWLIAKLQTRRKTFVLSTCQ